MDQSESNPLADKFFSKPEEEFIGANAQGSIDVSDADAQTGGLSFKEISELAFWLYESEGRPEGKAEEHWARAEEILRERRQKQATEESRPAQGLG